MKKLFFLLCCIFALVFFESHAFAQGSFFSPDSSSQEENTDGANTPSDDSSDQMAPQKEPSSSATNEDKKENPITLLDRVKIRVNNVILTQRQFAKFYALRKLSPSLSKLDDQTKFTEELTRLMGLEAYAKANNIYNLLPTRNEMNNRIQFFNSNLQVEKLSQAVAKIDPSGGLQEGDLRKFFYYQILREKGFVFALQKEFMNKIFTPREDEILLLYKQVLASEPKVFQTPIQIYIRNIAITEPANTKVKEALLKALEGFKNSIDALPTFEEKQKTFIAGIRKFSSSHLKNTESIGPLDEELVNRDFPEYKTLFNLQKGSTSPVINQDGFVRLVFIDSKEEGSLKPVDDPDIRQRLTGIIYNNKGESLFEDFMRNNLNDLDVQILGDDDGE